MPQSKQNSTAAAALNNSQLGSEDEADGPEHQTTGNFAEDYRALCAESESFCGTVRTVTAAPDLPVVPPKATSPTAPSAEDGEGEATEPSEPPTPSIKTSEARPKEYFDPSVELVVAKDDSEVKAMHVVGWRIPESSFQALLWTVKGYISAGHPCLTTLHFASAGLTDSMVTTLASTLRRVSTISTLNIHSNPPLAPLVLSGLLATDAFVGPSPLITLSVRFCEVSDAGATEIASELRKNFTLQSLSLFGNKLTDEGGTRLASALRINRTLKVLDIGHNAVGDATMAEFELALTEFPLNHDEIIARRRLLLIAAGVDDGPSDEHGDSRSGMRNTIMSRKSSKSDLRKGGKGANSPPKKGAKGKGAKDKKTPAPEEEKEPPSSPLIDPEPRRGERGQLFINGSWVLNCFNISRNNLTVEGLESLLRIALYQATHCAASDTEDPPTVLQGLVSVGYQQRGPIADADDVVKQLDDIFRTRDPRYVPPPAEEAAAATE